MGVYDACQSLVKRGETLFPFTCFDERVDWDGVLAFLLTIEWDVNGGSEQGSETKSQVEENTA